jgi:hypothetical protein
VLAVLEKMEKDSSPKTDYEWNLLVDRIQYKESILLDSNEGRFYRPEHKDFLYKILRDAKISSSRILGETPLENDLSSKLKINEISNGIFQFSLLKKSTCLKVIQEVMNIHSFYPKAPLNQGILHFLFILSLYIYTTHFS